MKIAAVIGIALVAAFIAATGCTTQEATPAQVSPAEQPAVVATSAPEVRPTLVYPDGCARSTDNDDAFRDGILKFLKAKLHKDKSYTAADLSKLTPDDATLKEVRELAFQLDEELADKNSDGRVRTAAQQRADAIQKQIFSKMDEYYATQTECRPSEDSVKAVEKANGWILSADGKGETVNPFVVEKAGRYVVSIAAGPIENGQSTNVIVKIEDADGERHLVFNEIIDRDYEGAVMVNLPAGKAYLTTEGDFLFGLTVATP